MTTLEPAAAVGETRKRTLWAWLAGTFFGIGLVSKGGGTLASVITVLLWWALAKSGISLGLLSLTTGFIALAATLLGIPAGTIVANELGKKDPSEVVLDEVAGQAIALIAVPVNWKYAICSLILFRAFDIVKPPPVRQLERLPGGTGIMMDDVAAGVLALVLLQTGVWFHLLG